MNIRFSDTGWIHAGASGIAFRSEPDLVRHSVTHELGHVLDKRLLDSESRQVVRNLFCKDIPQHPWTNNRDTPWHLTVGEDFGNTYAYIFHGERQPGAGLHWLTPPQVEWLRNYLLALDPSDRIWI